MLFDAFAQQDIVGKVLTQESSKPISFASIYINNTSIGTSSNEQGSFVIKNLKNKINELVITAVGYETVSLQIQLPLEKDLIITMKPKAIEIEEIVVLGYVKDGWQKWGVFFTESILGLGYHAEKTRIENPEVVQFRYDKNAKLLTAICSAPLKIKNDELGYLLTYDLTDFQMDFKENRLYFEGFAFFEDIGNNKSKFKKARKETYDISLMKFIRSTYQQRWEEDGYIVRKLVKKDNLVRLEALSTYKKLTDIVQKEYRNNWKLFYLSQKEYTEAQVSALQHQMRQPEKISYLMGIISTQDIIISEDVTQQWKEIRFDDFLYLIYPSEFQKSKNKMLKAAASQVSEIELLSGRNLIIDASGNFFPANQVVFNGYMVNYSKLAFLLPLDYQEN